MLEAGRRVLSKIRFGDEFFKLLRLHENLCPVSLHFGGPRYTGAVEEPLHEEERPSEPKSFPALREAAARIPRLHNN